MDDATVMDKFCCKLEKKNTDSNSYLLYPLFIHFMYIATTDQYLLLRIYCSVFIAQYLLLGDLALFCGKYSWLTNRHWPAAWIVGMEFHVVYVVVTIVTYLKSLRA